MKRPIPAPPPAPGDYYISAFPHSLGGLRNKAFGTDWLQLWVTPKGAQIRLVPAQEVSNAPLTDPPQADAGGFHSVFFDEDAGKTAWSTGRNITSFADPFLDYDHNRLSAYVDWLLEEAPEPSPALRDAALELRAAIDADVDWRRLGHRAFGMVNESELEAGSIPPVLFAIEPDPPMISDSSIGDDGIYVCYQQGPDGEMAFSAHGRSL